MEEAKKHLEKYRRKLREKYRRAGAELKYICCIEVGSRGGVHFHMIANRIEGGDAILSECWPHGHIHLTPSGLAIAAKIYERHTLLSKLLIMLGVNEKTAIEDACRMEHVISEESFEAIKEHVASKMKQED